VPFIVCCSQKVDINESAENIIHWEMHNLRKLGDRAKEKNKQHRHITKYNTTNSND